MAILIKVDEPRTRNLLRPYKRESSQHHEFELNQPTSLPLLHIPSMGQHLVTIRGPTGQNVLAKVNKPSHQHCQLTSVRSDIDQWTSEQQYSQPCQPLQPRHHLVEGTSPHRCLLPSHVAYREVARAGLYIYFKDDWCGIIELNYVDIDDQHHVLQRSYRHHQVQQRRHGRRLTSDGHQDLNEPVSPTSLTSDKPQPQLTSAEHIRRDTS